MTTPKQNEQTAGRPATVSCGMVMPSCPFCGSKQTIIIFSDAGTQHECRKCRARGPVFWEPDGTVNAAISGADEKWSTRHLKLSAIGPSTTDFDAWLETRKRDKERLELANILSVGYSVWRHAWLACEIEHGIRKG